MINWITVYTTSAFECPYCVKVKELLSIYGFDFYEKDIHTNSEYKTEFLEAGHTKVPQVYINDILIGGYTDSEKHFRREFFQGHPNKDKVIQELKDLLNVE
jgi:glutaredoxin